MRCKHPKKHGVRPVEPKAVFVQRSGKIVTIQFQKLQHAAKCHISVTQQRQNAVDAATQANFFGYGKFKISCRLFQYDACRKSRQIQRLVAVPGRRDLQPGQMTAPINF